MRYIGGLLATLLTFMMAVPTALAAGGNGVAQVTVMTRNLYLGGDIALALGTGSVQALIDGATQIFASVQATDFNERAEAIADEIAATQPDLIGLQEAALWLSRYPSTLAQDIATMSVDYDFVNILLQALAARHLAYDAVAEIRESEGQAPISEPGFHCEVANFVPSHCRDIRFIDRDVILAKRSVGVSGVTVTNPRTGYFLAQFSVPLPNGTVFTSKRGWASVDARIRGHGFRFVTAHLEPDVLPVQVAQAAEIVAGPGSDTSLPLVFVCDCNSPADASGSSTYANLVIAGLRDAWTEKPPVKPGYTCCQAGDLLNLQSALDERIDLIWLRGGVWPVELRTVGDANHDRTVSGLWPSDHAGVVGKLLVQ